jgi:hypothetical protein
LCAVVIARVARSAGAVSVRRGVFIGLSVRFACLRVDFNPMLPYYTPSRLLLGRVRRVLRMEDCARSRAGGLGGRRRPRACPTSPHLGDGGG